MTTLGDGGRVEPGLESNQRGKTKQTTFSSRPGSNVPEPDISTLELLAFGARSFFVVGNLLC